MWSLIEGLILIGPEVDPLVLVASHDGLTGDAKRDPVCPVKEVPSRSDQSPADLLIVDEVHAPIGEDRFLCGSGDTGDCEDRIRGEFVACLVAEPDERCVIKAIEEFSRVHLVPVPFFGSLSLTLGSPFHPVCHHYK